MSDSTRAAVFLDRDGTIIEDASFIRDPRVVALIPGVADVIKAWNDAGTPVIVVTNQSGIARGTIAPKEYQAVAGRIDQLLKAAGAYVDATFVCPHLPNITGPCDCRKPGTLLFRQAATEHRLDLTRSLFVGDRLRDVQPGVALGGRAVLVPSAATPADDLAAARLDSRIAIEPTLADAARRA